jgi:16S rRNA C967 or C1407 C5-methylase (RsmB/RsmF family)
MIPPLVLDAKANENILDMCAAPGGKTSEICALSNNTVMITACEKNKIRTERLKYNLDKLGCKKVNILNNDSRRLDNFLKFDKILLDAPCSGSGTLYLNEDNNNFNEDLINRSVRFQTELLSKAFELINSGGTIIYSTCSIFDEENDGVVDIVSKKYNFDVEKISINLDKAELLDSKYGLLIKPNEYYEGFYVSKLIKK